MKKLFFFRSSSSSSGNNSTSPPPTDKQVYWEKPLDSCLNNKAGDKHDGSFRRHEGLLSKSGNQASESQTSRVSSGLRRSRSLSSTAFFGDEPEETNCSCSNDISVSARHQKCSQSFSSRALTPERRGKENRYQMVPTGNAYELERPSSDISSGNSFSSNASSKVVDRYIDGEQQERSGNKKKINVFDRNTHNGRSGTRPPRFQHMEFPTSTYKEKQRSHSFREADATHVPFSSKQWVDNGFGHESPRRLAKNVIEKLSKSRPLPKSKSRDHDHGSPITIEDIYGGSLDRSFDLSSDVATQKCQMYKYSERIGEHHQQHDYSGSEKQSSLLEDTRDFFKYADDEDIDVELERKSKQAEERIMLLSEELEQESFLRDGEFDVDALMQRIRKLTEEKMGLALEVSGLLQSRITERSSMKKELRQAKSELEFATLRLEKEKNELQSALEIELDRRSSEWSSKLEKYQSEEHRLRKRAQELAEQNVSLQREVSSLHEKEKESRCIISHLEQQLKELTMQNEKFSQENFIIEQNFSELQQKCREAEDDRDCLKRNFDVKDNECKELHKSVSRLLRTCNEQEKTIEALREGLSEETGNKYSEEIYGKHVKKLQAEQIRLTGIELGLRREVESYKFEVDSLRHENINLLNRLKTNGKDSDVLTFKLDKEMWSRICCLQNQGLLMLNESTRLCSNLLDLVKEKASEISNAKQGMEVITSGLDGQFIIESEMKVQSLKRGIEALTRSLQTLSSLLHEKSSPLSTQSRPQSKDIDGSRQQNDKSSEDVIRSELKAENLLTSLLREKIYSKELEVEQLQAELATAARGNDILRCEVQSAMDHLSCVTHKLKDLELQMLEKDDKINQLQSNLQDSTEELTNLRRILPKVSQERDQMWEEVKQYREKNMLLDLELKTLKKKIDTLDEDILLKEGQITILKDALGKTTFDLLESSGSTSEHFFTMTN